MSPKKAKGLKLKEAKHLIANFQQSKTSRCAAVKKKKKWEAISLFLRSYELLSHPKNTL